MVDNWSIVYSKNKKFFQKVEELPVVPLDILDWIKEVRPKAEGRPEPL